MVEGQSLSDLISYGSGKDGRRSLGKGSGQLFCSDRKKEKEVCLVKPSGDSSEQLRRKAGKPDFWDAGLRPHLSSPPDKEQEPWQSTQHQLSELEN